MGVHSAHLLHAAGCARQHVIATVLNSRVGRGHDRNKLSKYDRRWPACIQQQCTVPGLGREINWKLRRLRAGPTGAQVLPHKLLHVAARRSTQLSCPGAPGVAALVKELDAEAVAAELLKGLPQRRAPARVIGEKQKGHRREVACGRM